MDHLHLADGGEYVGAVVNGEPHGKGRARWPAGTRTVVACGCVKQLAWAAGLWRRGTLHGFAVLKLADGGWFRGEMVAGKLGYGTLHADGRTLYGPMGEESESTAIGVQSFDNGDLFAGRIALGRYLWSGGAVVFEGKFEQDGRKQVGVKQGENARFTGEMKDGRMAKGLLQVHAKGKGFDAYRGKFEGNEFHGKGIYQFANEDYVQGEFVKGKVHGRAKFASISGSSFVGRWKEDKIASGAVQWEATGQKFEGQFDEAACATNDGKKTFPDGSAWEGPFINGVPHGKGTFTFGDKHPKAGSSVPATYFEGILDEQELQNTPAASIS